MLISSTLSLAAASHFGRLIFRYEGVAILTPVIEM